MTPRICQEYGIKEPAFKEVSQGFLVILYNEKRNPIEKLTDLKTDLKTNTIEEKIITLILANNKISIPQIAQEIGKGITITKQTIAKLKAENKITRIGPDKGGHWEVEPGNKRR